MDVPLYNIQQLRQHAERGNLAAMFTLASFRWTGHGTEVNYEEAFYWFAKAAKKGHRGAMCGLAACYWFGHGTSTDYKGAFDWFLKANRKGSPCATRVLCYCHEDSDGPEVDSTQVEYWFEMAADSWVFYLMDELKFEAWLEIKRLVFLPPLEVVASRKQ